MVRTKNVVPKMRIAGCFAPTIQPAAVSALPTKADRMPPKKLKSAAIASQLPGRLFLGFCFTRRACALGPKDGVRGL